MLNNEDVGISELGGPSTMAKRVFEGETIANFGFDVNGEKLQFYGKDDKESMKSYDEAFAAFENSHVIVNIVESELSFGSEDGDLPLLESNWIAKDDESMALWVKCRGRWQAGIKCEKTDWPLDTVKARPTNDRKNYIVVFFPHRRNYSWVDTRLVRPINEFPNPVVHNSHEAGIESVKDLYVARRFIMQKLAVGVLNIIDRLNFQVLVEDAQNFGLLKEFAMEAPRCKGYSDLGMMLVKLQKMLLEQYIDANWLSESYGSWANQCQKALTAESTELLREELVNSILWKEISAVKDIDQEPPNATEWKMWKHEVIKLFLISYPISSGEESVQPVKPVVEHQGTSPPFFTSPRKRPKLEVRRAEPNANKRGHEDAVAEIDTEFFIRPSAEAVDSTSQDDSTADKPDMNGIKGRKCKAYIEAKGRQCVRWANEGDEYCCVHLAARFTGNTVKAAIQPAIDAPICGGTTTQGTRCKHRALPGSLHCKKHRPRDGPSPRPSPSPGPGSGPFGKHLKRKHDEFSMDIMLAEENGQPLQVEPLSMRVVHNGTSNLIMMPCCVGSGLRDGVPYCSESPKKHSLYCDKHLPSWLKRARNGKSRIISKEVFIELLKECPSQDQKLHLHQACELFYKFFKSILSLRNQVPKEIQFQWALSEASKAAHVTSFLMKLVSCEKARIKRIWGFDFGREEQTATMPAKQLNSDQGITFKCKFCHEDFADGEALGTHCIKNHNKEAQWYFRGYACSICLDSFTNRKVLETHVQDRHHAQFSDHCMLLRCMPCGGHFGHSDELWSHILSSHTDAFTESINNNEQQGQAEPLAIETISENHSNEQQGQAEPLAIETISENHSTARRYICKFCGLKFDLLPDLGRHHQAAHMSVGGSRPSNKGIQFYAYRTKTGRLTRPKFRKTLSGLPSCTLKNKTAASLKKRLQASKPVNSHKSVSDDKCLGKLTEPESFSLARILRTEAQTTRARPSNMEILNTAQNSCCKVSLQARLEEKYKIVPDRLYLRAAKLCSEHNIEVSWHQEGFRCTKGCEPRKDQSLMSVSNLRSKDCLLSVNSARLNDKIEAWEKDECHYVLNSVDLRRSRYQTTIILCDDISFGKESVPIACVVDKSMLDSLLDPSYGVDGQVTFLPWESFSYVKRPILDSSVHVHTQSMHSKCDCSQAVCSPETCDHVYLFNTDHEDAKDINGELMNGKFSYDENGKIILQEGYLVYECNDMCSCSKSCPNRILQNGVQVKLEVFKTLKKGWAVRAAESISHGTFVCEFVGEVLDEQEESRRCRRLGNRARKYFYNTSACMKKISPSDDEQRPRVIDSSKFGNISRFVNHSCSPNLAARLVLVEGMDYELAHVGLYANQDIAVGEELSCDYGFEVLPGEGSPCYCGSSSCRGRVF